LCTHVRGINPAFIPRYAYYPFPDDPPRDGFYRNGACRKKNGPNYFAIDAEECYWHLLANPSLLMQQMLSDGQLTIEGSAPFRFGGPPEYLRGDLSKCPFYEQAITPDNELNANTDGKEFLFCMDGLTMLYSLAHQLAGYPGEGRSLLFTPDPVMECCKTEVGPCEIVTTLESFRPCMCSVTGVIYGTDTGRAGCKKHTEGGGYFCHVREECDQANVAPAFPGTKWRSCDPIADEVPAENYICNLVADPETMDGNAGLNLDVLGIKGHTYQKPFNVSQSLTDQVRQRGIERSETGSNRPARTRPLPANQN